MLQFTVNAMGVFRSHPIVAAINVIEPLVRH